MIHPSYSELMQVVNSNAEPDEEPIVNSRYSIVLATSKRARQLIAGEESLLDDNEYVVDKPLSTAVKELYTGKVKILPYTEDEFEDRTEEITDEAGSAETAETTEETTATAEEE